MITDNAFILHKRNYQDSSELLKLFTQNQGIIDAVAKGSRNPKSKFKGQLQPFIDCQITVSGKSNLKTLTGAEQVGVLSNSSYLNHVSMLYCNELLLLLNLDEETSRLIYPHYKKTISQLVDIDQPHMVLRYFEWQLCCIQGYRLDLNSQIAPNDYIEFNPTSGLQKSQRNQYCKSQYFQDFVASKTLSSSAQKGINRLMKTVVNHLVNGKPIQSRLLLK